jgi:hypothetical protein
MGEGFTAFLVSCILSFIIAFGLMFVFRFKEKDILEEEVAK